MQNLFLKTLKKKWPEYLLEIIVLIIGIYGAFAVDSWKERNDLKESAYNHIQVLKNDLSFDQTQLEAFLDIMEVNMKACNYILDGYKRIHKMDSSAYYAFSKLAYEYNFNPQTAALNALRNTGSLTALTDDLQQQISVYYAAASNVQEREEISNSFIKANYETKLIENYPFVWSKPNIDPSAQEVYFNDQRKTRPFNDEIFLADKSLEMVVFGRRFQTLTQKQSYENGLAELEKLKRMLYEMTD